MNLFALYIITLVSSFCSLAYQILIAHFLTEQIDIYIISQTTTFGIYALACGLGIIFFNQGQRDIFKFFLKIEIYLILSSFIIPLTFVLCHIFFNIFLFEKISQIFSIPIYYTEKSMLFLLAQIGVFILGFISGMEISSILKIKDKLYHSETKYIGLIFCAGYIGGLISSLVVPSVFVVHVGSLIGFLIVGSINLIFLLLFFILFYYKKWISRYLIYYGFSLSFFLGFLFLMSPGLFFKLENYNLKVMYSQVSVEKFNSNSFKNAHRMIGMLGDVQRFRSLYQTIDILDANFNSKILYFFKKMDFKILAKEKHPNFYLFLNRNLQFSSSGHKSYHESIAHAPINVTGHTPKNILILGGGDGILIKELLRYGKDIKITLVEIDQKIIDLSKNHVLMKSLNQNSLSSSQVTVIIQDALQFIKYTKNTYDAIYIDIPFPSNYNFMRLYSKEFFFNVNRRLDQDGFMIIDTIKLDMEDHKIQSKILINTLISAGFKKNRLMGFGDTNHFIIGIKKDKKMEFDYDNIGFFETNTLLNLRPVTDFDKIPIDADSVHSLYKPKWFLHL